MRSLFRYSSCYKDEGTIFKKKMKVRKITFMVGKNYERKKLAYIQLIPDIKK